MTSNNVQHNIMTIIYINIKTMMSSIHVHTNIQTHRHTDTQTHRHTDIPDISGPVAPIPVFRNRAIPGTVPAIFGPRVTIGRGPGVALLTTLVTRCSARGAFLVSGGTWLLCGGFFGGCKSVPYARTRYSISGLCVCEYVYVHTYAYVFVFVLVWGADRQTERRTDR